MNNIKKIPNLDGYFCDHQGLVYSGWRKGPKGGFVDEPRKKMKLQQNNGYLMFRVSYLKKALYVHRAMAMTFLGGIPDGHIVDHIDGNKANNNVKNLRVVTKSFNVSGERRRKFQKSTFEPEYFESDGQFKTIVGFSKYEIDRQGNIRNKKSGRFLKQHVPPTGYRKLNLSRDCGKRQVVQQVHRLLALTWIDNPDGKDVVNHIDHDKLNCRYENLEWATRSENAKAFWENKKNNN